LKFAPLLLLLASTAARGAAPPPAETASSPPEIEEAADVARQSAQSLLRGRASLFEEALDLPPIEIAATGPALLPLLNERQRRELRENIVPVVEAMIVPRPDPRGTVLELEAVPAGGEIRVALLLSSVDGAAKTVWRMRQRHGQWRIQDVLLTDTGVSARDQSLRFFGPGPAAVPRDQRREIRDILTPRLAGIVACFLVTAIFLRRLNRKERVVLLAAAVVPVLLFSLDALLACSRCWREPVRLSLEPNLARERFVARFHAEVSRQNLAAARASAASALAAGSPVPPIALALGNLSEQLGRAPEAELWFERALSSPDPAPGGWAGLARLALRREKWADAEGLWKRYLAATPKDPTSLALLATAQGRQRNFTAARETIAQALALKSGDPDVLDLSARLAGADSDAAEAIDFLRREEAARPLDRKEIAGDPVFGPIADDPAWKSFLSTPAPKNPS
jgi:tetratricopeptide (TPR) repeat protein